MITHHHQSSHWHWYGLHLTFLVTIDNGHCCCHSDRTWLWQMTIQWCWYNFSWLHGISKFLLLQDYGRSRALCGCSFVLMSHGYHNDRWKNSIHNTSRNVKLKCITGPHHEFINFVAVFVAGLQVSSMKLVTYFSVFKLWLTLRASASAVAPEPPILFPSRLWKSE